MCVVAVALLAGCQADDPAFASKEFHFRAKFPRAPEVKETRGAGTIFTTFSTVDPDGVFQVEVWEGQVKGDEPGDEVQKMLDNARDHIVHRAGGELKSSKPATIVGKYPGREFTASVSRPVGLLRARVYIARARVYRVSVMGTTDYANSPAATAFLDSFQLTE
jgi:hypothetical protein